MRTRWGCGTKTAEEGIMEVILDIVTNFQL